MSLKSIHVERDFASAFAVQDAVQSRESFVLREVGVESPLDLSGEAEWQERIGCVLFTSGSTGSAKAVAYSWELLDWVLSDNLRQLARGDARARTTGFAPIAHNAGFLRALLPLDGPHVEFMDPRVVSAQDILEAVIRERINQISFTPALAAVLAEAARTAGVRLTGVHTAYVFGEKVAWRHISLIRGLIDPSATVIVRYAATEAPGGILNFEIPWDMAEGEGLVPLGFPVFPGRVKLVRVGDGVELQQIAVREPIALGYVGAGEADARRFVVDDEGVRWWLSGDLARVDEEGCYHFLGRSDDRVKIRGEIIDPGRAERVLLENPAVKNAVVLAHDRGDAYPTLVAHLELHPEGVTSPNELFQIMFDALEPREIPGMLVRHEEIPVTDRGKIDRRTLQGQVWPRWKESAGTARSGSTHRIILRVLIDVLDQPDLSPTEDLWGAGMDSLAALEFTTTLETLGFGVFPPTILLGYRTAEELGTYCELSGGFQKSSRVVLNREGTQPPIFALPAAGATALSFALLASELGPQQPVVALEPRGMHTDGQVSHSIRALSETAFQDIMMTNPVSPVRLLGHCAGGRIALDVAHRLSAAGLGVEVVLLETRGVFSKPRPSSTAWAVERVRLWWASVLGWLQARASLGVGARLKGGSLSSSGARYALIRQSIERASRTFQLRPFSFRVVSVDCEQVIPEHIAVTYPTLEIATVPGKHLDLLRRPWVVQVAQTLNDVYQKAKSS